jgi:hypothetical protein
LYCAALFTRSGGGSAWSSSSSIFSSDESSDKEDSDGGIDEWLSRVRNIHAAKPHTAKSGSRSEEAGDDGGIDEWLSRVRNIHAAKPHTAKSGSRSEEADDDGGIDEWLSRARNVKAVSKSDTRLKDAPSRRYKFAAATHVPLAVHGVVPPSRRTRELSDKLAELDKDTPADTLAVSQPTQSVGELSFDKFYEPAEKHIWSFSTERIAPCPPPRTTCTKAALSLIDRVDHYSAKLMQCTDMVMSALDFDYDDDLR